MNSSTILQSTFRKLKQIGFKKKMKVTGWFILLTAAVLPVAAAVMIPKLAEQKNDHGKQPDQAVISDAESENGKTVEIFDSDSQQSSISDEEKPEESGDSAETVSEAADVDEQPAEEISEHVPAMEPVEQTSSEQSENPEQPQETEGTGEDWPELGENETPFVQINYRSFL